MSNRLGLRYNTGAQDGSLFADGYQHCLFKPEPWSVAGDKIRQIYRNKLLAPEVAFSKRIYNDYEKFGTFLEDVKLDIVVSPIVGAGVGTYARLTDYAGLALIPRIEVIYQQNTLQQYTNLGLFIDQYRDHDITHREVFLAGLGGGLTAAQRNTRALANQKFTTYLKPYWYGIRGHCPILTALANKLKIYIEFANLGDVVETDYTLGATATIVSAEFKHDLINLTGADREEASKVTFTAQGQSYLFQNKTVLPYKLIPAGTTSIVNDLKGLVNPFFSIYFILQRVSDFNTNFQKRPFRLNVSDFTNIAYSCFQDASGVKLQEITDYKEFADVWQKFHCSAQWLLPIGCYSATEIADIKNAALGSFNAGNINNFQHVINFTAPTGQDLYISYVVYEHNWINHQAGELQRVFN